MSCWMYYIARNNNNSNNNTNNINNNNKNDKLCNVIATNQTKFSTLIKQPFNPRKIFFGPFFLFVLLYFMPIMTRH